MNFFKKYIFLLCICLTGCNSVFFHPTKEAVISPDQLGLKYEAVKIDDGQGPVLYAWFLPAEGKALGTILHLHGNAENISTHLASVYWLPSHSYNVLTLDYRGYGNSEGVPSMEGVHQDALRAANYLKVRANTSEPLFLYGQSLGASIALYTAASEQGRNIFKAVMAESAFASYPAIAREKLASFWLTSLLRYPLAATISSFYDPIKVVDRIGPTSLLFVHSKADQIVSYEHSQHLFDKAKEPKQLWLIENAEHIQIFKEAVNRKRLLEFLKQVATDLS